MLPECFLHSAPEHLPTLSPESWSPSSFPWHYPKYPSLASSLPPSSPHPLFPASFPRHSASGVSGYAPPAPSLISLCSLYPTVSVLHIPGGPMPSQVTAFCLFQPQNTCPNITPLIPILSLPFSSSLQVNALPSPSCLGDWQKHHRSTERRQASCLQL